MRFADLTITIKAAKQDQTFKATLGLIASRPVSCNPIATSTVEMPSSILRRLVLARQRSPVEKESRGCSETAKMLLLPMRSMTHISPFSNSGFYWYLVWIELIEYLLHLLYCSHLNQVRCVTSASLRFEAFWWLNSVWKIEPSPVFNVGFIRKSNQFHKSLPRTHYLSQNWFLQSALIVSDLFRFPL